MAALIEVRPMNARGASRMRAEMACASASLPTGVQSMTTLCSPSDAHSMKHTRDAARWRPPVMARTTRGSTIAAA